MSSPIIPHDGAVARPQSTIPAMRVSFSTIPAPLRALPLWCNFDLTRMPDGTLLKLPIDPVTHFEAKIDDPSTLGTFDQVRQNAVEYRWAIGVAIVAPFFFFDADGVRNPATGWIDPDALALIRRLDTYVETSISAKGLHAIGVGAKPGTRCRIGNCELYDRDRFCIVTGGVIPGFPTTINPAQDALNALYAELFPEKAVGNGEESRAGTSKETTATPSTVNHSGIVSTPSPPMADREVLRLARRMGNGAGEKFRALWRGDTSAHDGDDSRADAALISYLAFFTQDPVQLDRLFRKSGLCRTAERKRKWGRQDYRDRTIGFVLTGLRATYQPPQPLILRADGTFDFTIIA